MSVAPSVEPLADKAMLRVYHGASKGATAFFRNRPLLTRLMTLCAAMPGKRLKVLFHAGSIGADVYSFAIHSLLAGLTDTRDIELWTTDIDPEFIAFAENARYPASILAPMTHAERDFFDVDGDTVTPCAAVRRLVGFLPPLSFVEAESDERFDLVFVTNALTYVTPQQQAATIDRIARYNSAYLIITAFHPDTIRDDLTRGGYEPVTEDIEAIHAAWSERIVDAPPERGTPEYSWKLPRFSRTADHAFRYCAIFRKLDATVRSAD